MGVTVLLYVRAVNGLFHCPKVLILLVSCLAADVDPFVLCLFASLAEKKRTMISARSKSALAAAKAQGVKRGGPKLAQAR